MIKKQSFLIPVIFLFSMSCLFFQATAQSSATAKRLMTRSDSLVATYSSNAKLLNVVTSNIDTNGVADSWTYTYISVHSTDETYYWVHGQNDQVTMMDSSLVNGRDIYFIANPWMDSDSAMLIAQRFGGSALIKQFPAHTISAELMILAVNPLPIFTPKWMISYHGATHGGILILDATTGEVGSWIITSINDNNIPLIPNYPELSQNYPNPFNPITNITFSLPSEVYASLKIFDINGREIATIVSELLHAGIYTRQWNAGKMPSGVYFYRLQAGMFTETKIIILLK